MLSAIVDALTDTAKMIPLMIVIFVGIEIFEHKYGKNFRPLLKRSRVLGPIVGALLGIIPQCGFSVISTILYAEGAISTGTLLSVYLATSDEAIPVILSQPSKAYTLIPLLLSKLIIAIAAGYIIDGIFGLAKKESPAIVNSAPCTHEEDGCCGSTCIDEELSFKNVFKHALSHSIKVLTYILAVSVLLNLLLYFLGEQTLSRIFMKESVLQPVLTGLIGLIPNCAVSVAITQVFLDGGMTFGSVVAGLSSSAGMGLIVLFKEVKDKKSIYTIVLLLFAISVLAGVILNLFIPSTL